MTNLAQVAIATTSQRRADARLLVVEPGKGFCHAGLDELGAYLKSGDVLVVNDAATLPASFHGVHKRTAAAIELRLVQHAAPAPEQVTLWRAVVFGAGDWRQDTEVRPAPPSLRIGDVLALASKLKATIVAIDEDDPRLVTIRFDGNPHSVWRRLYRAGKPIQYSYHEQALALWDLQTIFAVKPVALEAPSSAFHFTWQQIFALENQGIKVVSLTHATGISSTGDKILDRRLPFPERYWLPELSAEAIRKAKASGSRVIALGTGVTRALESAVASDGNLRAGAATTDLKLSPDFQRRVVDGLVTGMHEADSSHLKLLASFIAEPELSQAYEAAIELGYLWHEYGDLNLIL